MPCPMIGVWQWLQRGASMWIAQAKLSNVWVVPPIETSNALSYVLPHISQGFMLQCGCKQRACVAHLAVERRLLSATL